MGVVRIMLVPGNLCAVARSGQNMNIVVKRGSIVKCVAIQRTQRVYAISAVADIAHQICMTCIYRFGVP
ncbi:hypothetical protein DSECCO2_622850 [anaerobic digester metagenome]